MEVSKAEFIEWKQNPITEGLWKFIREEVQTLSAKILTAKTFDRDRDQFTKGQINGLSEAFDWEPEFTQEEGILDDITS